MTAKEEDILTTQSYIKDGSVLDKLFQSLIVSNGNGEPNCILMKLNFQPNLQNLDK